MPHTLFFDGFAGAAGDMLIGAMLDAGVDRSAWEAELARLALPKGSYAYRIDRVSKLGIQATKFTVMLGDREADSDLYELLEDGPGHQNHGHEHHPHEGHQHDHAPHEHRGLLEIEGILDRSPIAAPARDLAKRIFRNLAIAEGTVHGQPPEAVHFHEVGAIDAIVDITGFAIAHHLMGADRVVVSPIAVGSGLIRCAHGIMPVPVPAVVELLKAAGAPLRASDLKGEWLTPTGAAILTTIADTYAPMVAFQKLTASGFGAGKRDHEAVPNVVRLLVGIE